MIGVALAGGRGARMAPRSKPAVEVAGRPLLHWVLDALGAACADVAVACKSITELPSLPAGVERWDEPEERFHPAAGIAYALDRAGGDVLVCAADMPLVDGATLRVLAARGSGEPAVVAVAGGRLQPVLGLYRQAALAGLREAAPNASLTATVEALGPARVEVAERVVLSVDSPEAAAEAERLLLSA